MPPRKTFPPILDSRNSFLLIIDIQERFSRVMNQDHLKRVTANIDLLATLASELKMPMMLTEQYPQGLGETIPPVKNILKDKRADFLSKVTFGCCEDKNFVLKILPYQRKQVILTGMETHVCVYLTALGLLTMGYQPVIASDAVISRTTFHHKNGLDLLRQTGSLVSNTETLLFQLMGRSGTPLFKQISSRLKESIPG